MSGGAVLDSRVAPAENPLAEWWKYALMVLVLAPIAIAFFWPLLGVQDSTISTYTWVLVWISAFFNVMVIFYHFAVPPHPKFLILGWRRFWIRVHVFSGVTEFTSGLVALLTGSPIAATIMAIVALGFHVPSATVQTRIVFGAKAVMWPSYVLCVLTHAFCAVNLLLHPTSAFWAVNTFLIFNIYVWCRVTYYLFDWLGLFSSMKYTIAILAAGVLLFPTLTGPLGPLFFGSFVIAFVILYKCLFVRTPGDYEAFVREAARDTAIGREVAELWDTASSEQENRRLARQLFDNLDEDKNGSLQTEELQTALASWGLPEDIITAFVRKYMSSGALDFEQFYRHIWSVGAVRHKAKWTKGARESASERDKADFVFHQLDLDQSNTVSAYELQLLLLQWGLPSSEVKKYFTLCDSVGDGEIAFDDFFHKMRPIWRFIFYEVIRAEAGPARQEGFGRLLAAAKDTRQTGSVRRVVKQELLSRVSFLQNADERLIEDLASSLVTETFRADSRIFAEGSEGDKFYLTGAGSVHLTAGGENIADLPTGAYFGEGALIIDAPRSATAIAAQDCTLYSMTRSSFDFLVGKYPRVKEDLQAIHKNRREMVVKRTLQQKLLDKVSFLRQASPQLIDELAGSLAEERFRSGDTLIQEGIPGDRFFVMVNGSVRFSKDGEVLHDAGAGAHFGERSLLTNAPRSATVNALEDTQVLVLRRESFEQIISKYPDVRAKIASAWGNGR